MLTELQNAPAKFMYCVHVVPTDIAVGAPYDGSGRVYLYCGSSTGINKNAAQVGMYDWKPGRDSCPERESWMFWIL